MKATIFFGGSFSNRDNVRPQSNLEQKVNPSLIFPQGETHPISHQENHCYDRSIKVTPSVYKVNNYRK